MSLMRLGEPTLRSDIDRFFNDRFFNDWWQQFLPRTTNGQAPVWSPPVNIREDEKNLYFEAELPGMQRKDIDVEVKNNELQISGERRYEKKSEKENCHCVERSYGSFFRSFALPEYVKAEEVKAEYKDGLLSLTLPKTEAVKPKKVSIN